MDPGLYDFAKYKAQTSCFKGVATEELPARNGQALEIMDIGRFGDYWVAFREEFLFTIKETLWGESG